jgi:hypothetical protein
LHPPVYPQVYCLMPLNLQGAGLTLTGASWPAIRNAVVTQPLDAEAFVIKQGQALAQLSRPHMKPTFCLACPVGSTSLTSTGSLLGPPELLQGGPATARSTANVAQGQVRSGCQTQESDDLGPNTVATLPPSASHHEARLWPGSS